MPQFEVRTGDPQQPGALGFLERGARVDVEDGERCPDDGEQDGVVGRRHQHERLTRLAQPPAAIEEDSLHLGGEWQRRR
jgi:hypothetical protein